MHTKIQAIKDILTSIQCQYAEVRFATGTGTTISLSGEQVDSFTSGHTTGGSVRILFDGAWGFYSFNDLNNIEEFIKKAHNLAKSSPSDENRKIAQSESIEKSFIADFEKDFRTISLDEKFALISKYNDILKNSEFIQTTRATYRDVSAHSYYLNSEGSVLEYDRLYTGISLASIAKDGSVIQPFHDSISGYGGYEIVENQENRAEEVIKTAVDLLKAESPSGGNYNIITDQKLAGVFIHEAFGHLSEADFIHENESMKKIMVIGSEFGPKFLNVYDDGSIKGLSGYIPYDDEGILPKKTSLINKGILNGRLHSRETAAAMDEETTGNGRAINSMRNPIVRMSNTYIDNGPHSKEEIFDSVDDGIYAVDVIGGQTNLEMFTFTSGFGYEIKNGKKGKMFKDIVLSGNVFATLKNISMIGNDKEMFGGLGGCGKGGQSPLPVSFGGPHMLINNVLVGGSQ